MAPFVHVCYHIFRYGKVTEWPPIGNADDMFSWYKHLIVNLFFVFHTSVFGVGIFS